MLRCASKYKYIWAYSYIIESPLHISKDTENFISELNSHQVLRRKCYLCIIILKLN